MYEPGILHYSNLSWQALNPIWTRTAYPPQTHAGFRLFGDRGRRLIPNRRQSSLTLIATTTSPVGLILAIPHCEQLGD
jgi:hypothetical protein